MSGKKLIVAEVNSGGPGSINNVSLCPDDFINTETVKHICLTFGSDVFYYSALMAKRVATGSILIDKSQLKWVPFKTGDKVKVSVVPVNSTLTSVTLKVFCKDPVITKDLQLEEGKLATEFRKWFKNKPLSLNQSLIVVLQNKELHLLVKGLVKGEEAASGNEVPNGYFQAATKLIFQAGKDSKVQIKTKGKNTLPDDEGFDEYRIMDKENETSSSPQKVPSIINPLFDFQNTGFGGLDDQFRQILRKLSSRLLPPEFLEQFGKHHVRGILLHGPPGTGKTLMARQLAQMFNCVEPKIVNASQLVGKFIGDNEANTRALFAEAADEQKRLGSKSRLHVIIFDEFDALSKKKGGPESANDTDSIVNTLLTILDGTQQLNNIFVIAMTNRRDLIEEALLRPGRFEIQIEFGLPNLAGREQILKIHMSEMIENNKLSEDVDLLKLAQQTAYFSGAEIEGLVKASFARALDCYVRITDTVEIDPKVTEMKVTMANCQAALCDIKPTFSESDEHLDCLIAPGITVWGTPVENVFYQARIVLKRAKTYPGITSLLLEGPRGAGKTAIAAQLIKDSGFPFVKICTPSNVFDLSDSEKCAHLRKMFDGVAQHESSCILVDDIEGIVDFVDNGLPFSSPVLRALMVLLNERTPAMRGRKLLVICTTSSRKLLEECEKLRCFRKIIHVPYLTTIQHLEAVLEKIGKSFKSHVIQQAVLDENDVFSESDITELVKMIGSRKISIPIKELVFLIELAVATDEYSRVGDFFNELQSGGFIYFSRS